MGILLIFNTFYLLINNQVITSFAIGGLMSIVVSAITLAIASGIQVMGTGISDSAIKILFSAMVILNVLFKVEIGGLTIGLGLAQNVVTVFGAGDFMGFGMILAGALTLMAFFSGMLMVAEDG